MDIMHTEWEVEEVPSDYILGIHRELNTDDPNNWTCKLTMSAYIENVVRQWEPHLIEAFGDRWEAKTKRTAWPDGCKLSKIDQVPPEEIQINLKKGYVSLVGSL